MQKATFQKEHLSELRTLATEFLFSNIIFKGHLGAGEFSVHNLLHTCSKETLSRLKDMFAKDVAADKLTLSTDEFAMTEEQLRAFMAALTRKEKSLRLLQLIIGYKNNLELKSAQRKNLREKQRDFKAAEESLKTPEQKLAELRAEIASLQAEIGTED